MSSVVSKLVRAIYLSRKFQNLPLYELPLGFAKFLRILKPDVFFVIDCPDLLGVCDGLRPIHKFGLKYR